MPGGDLQKSALFSFGGVSPDRAVPHDHPLRKLLALVNAALARMLRRFNSSLEVGGPRFDCAGKVVAAPAAAHAPCRAKRATAPSVAVLGRAAYSV
jgi:hypothetical protein